MIWRAFFRLIFFFVPFLLMLVTTPSEGFTKTDKMHWFLFTFIVFFIMYGLYKLVGKFIISIPLILSLVLLFIYVDSKGGEGLIMFTIITPLFVACAVYSLGLILDDIFLKKKEDARWY